MELTAEKVVFRHDESRNHIYGDGKDHKSSYEHNGNNYFADIDGEFAIGLVSDGNVILARDWVGSVPYHFMVTSDGDVVTTNDIKTLMEHPEYNYRHVRAVRAGHAVSIPLQGR